MSIWWNLYQISPSDTHPNLKVFGSICLPPNPGPMHLKIRANGWDGMGMETILKETQCFKGKDVENEFSKLKRWLRLDLWRSNPPKLKGDHDKNII